MEKKKNARVYYITPDCRFLHEIDGNNKDIPMR